MTEQKIKEGQEILKTIKYIRELRGCMFSAPIIKENSNTGNYIYLSWADNENSDLKNTIINWCDNEIKRLQTKFDEL